MKNLFKFGFLALAITLSIAACNSGKTESSTVDSDSLAAASVDSLDSTASATVDSVDSTADAQIDSIKK